MSMKALLLALFLALPVVSGVAEAADTEVNTNASPDPLASAIFAGGCFWCMEHPFDELGGVVSTTSGYIGGHTPSPTYPQVSSGATGHAEAVRVIYDPAKVGYDRLLWVFWRNVDPLDGGGQFCDRGDQYRTGVFFVTEEQHRLAEQSKQELTAAGRFDRPIVTAIAAAGEFYPAEDYHQDYYLVNPVRYKYYRYRCGRDQRLQELWGDEAPKAAG
jgi:peptide-methionine (S)-S-oxide reductase